MKFPLLPLAAASIVFIGVAAASRPQCDVEAIIYVADRIDG